jgi:hypothetical protein
MSFQAIWEAEILRIRSRPAQVKNKILHDLISMEKQKLQAGLGKKQDLV